MFNKLIKNEFIKNYIKENKKAPTQQQIKSYVANYLVENPSVEDDGFVAGSKINFSNVPGKESSSSNYNFLLDRIIKEQEAFRDFYLSEVENLENQFRNFKSIFNRVYLKLKNIEKNLNKELLLHEKNDIYSYGIVEDFTTYGKVNFDLSDVHFFNGKATLGFRKLINENIKDKEIKYSLINRNKLPVEQERLSSFTNALKEDGSFFKLIGKTKSKNDLLDFVVEIKFNQPKHVDTLKFITDSVEKTSTMSYTCFVSTDGSSYKEVFESSLRLENGANYVEINQADVRYIKLILTKYSYDYEQGSYYNYMFSLDFIGLTTKSYQINKKSTLFLGPYEIKDEEENPVNYNFATMRYGTCCLIPEKTSIKFFLSKDNLSWIPLSYTGSGKEVVQFSESEADINLLFENVDINNESQVIKVNSPISLNDNEAILNYRISEENYNSLIIKTLKIKRNVLEKNNINNLFSGWKKEKDFYSTTINIKNPEGKYINLGNTSISLNGRSMTGKIFIPFGEHKIVTNKSNYFNILNSSNRSQEDNILNARELKSVDNLYPFNHKYLIEGFKYNNDFAGRKVYSELGEVYQERLVHISNERFEVESSSEYFTIVKYDNFYYFKIKIESNSGDSKVEKFKLECNKKSDVNSNLLYIKAIIESSDPRVTPKIDQVQVRVI